MIEAFSSQRERRTGAQRLESVEALPTLPVSAITRFFAEDSLGTSLNFVSEGQGYRFQKHTLARDENGNAIAFNAGRFGPDTPNDWQLSRGAHLVEVEINGGAVANVDTVYALWRLNRCAHEVMEADDEYEECTDGDWCPFHLDLRSIRAIGLC